VWRADAENDAIRALARVVRELGPLHLTGPPAVHSQS
jgi:hypothetical protein